MVGFEGCLCDVLQGSARTFTWFTELNEMYVVRVGFLVSFRHQLWGNCGKHVDISLCIELESIDQVYFVLFSEKGFEILHKDFEGRSFTVCDLLLIYKKKYQLDQIFSFFEYRVGLFHIVINKCFDELDTSDLLFIVRKCLRTFLFHVCLDWKAKYTNYYMRKVKLAPLELFVWPFKF